MEQKYANVKPNKQGVINNKAILNEAYSMNDSIDRYGILKDRVQEQLGVSSKQAENYLKPFADGNSLNVEASREVNNKLKADVQRRTERMDRRHDEALKMNEQLDAQKAHNNATKKRIMVERTTRETPSVTPGQHLNYTDRKAAKVHKKEVNAAFERAVKADQGINNIVNSAPKNAMGQPMLNQRQAEMIKALKGQENTAFPSMTAPQFTKRHGEIPTEAKAFKQSQNAARKKIQQQSVNQAKKEIAQEATEAAAKKAGKMAKLGKVGKIAAGVGITAAVVSNMNKSKGQQSNAELYGQRTPYGY